MRVGLNPVDYKLAATGYPGWEYPFILGLDVAGVVDAVGQGVAEWEEGDPVYYHGRYVETRRIWSVCDYRSACLVLVAGWFWTTRLRLPCLVQAGRHIKVCIANCACKRARPFLFMVAPVVSAVLPSNWLALQG